MVFYKLDDFDTDSQWIETLSWSPRVFLFHNFVSEIQCEHILQLKQIVQISKKEEIYEEFLDLESLHDVVVLEFTGNEA